MGATRSRPSGEPAQGQWAEGHVRSAGTAHRDRSALAGADGQWDVVVAGGGNAALVSAIAADEAGCRVLVLERSPLHMRGGNSRHTRNIRCVHEADPYNSGAYSYDELWKDLCGVGEGPNNEELASFTRVGSN